MSDSRAGLRNSNGRAIDGRKTSAKFENRACAPRLNSAFAYLKGNQMKIRVDRFSSHRWAVVLALAIACKALACPEAPFFSGVGYLASPPGSLSSSALGVSSDGLTVVGNSTSRMANCGSEAFRWSSNVGIVGLGDLPGNCFGSSAGAVSADGSVIVGTGSSQLSGSNEGFRWTLAGGLVGLGDLSVPIINSSAGLISDDGALVAGHCGPTHLKHPCIWTTASGWTQIAPAGTRQGSAWGMSNNGAWVVGYSENSFDFNERPFRWSSATGAVTLGNPIGSLESYAYGVSNDGAVTGFWVGSGGAFGFKWTEADGFIDLGSFIPNGGISPDGTIMAGYYYDLGYQAAIMDATMTVRRAADVLAENGVVIPCGWTLKVVTDVKITCGVVTLIGYATNPNGDQEGWIARYVPGSDPVAPCDDGDPCTDDGCDPTMGCTHDFNNAPCDDGNPGTLNDLCDNGVCVGTADAIFGDLNGDSTVGIDDILCMLASFAGNGDCAGGLANADISPCGGNGMITIDDILAVLQAFAGADLCP